MRDYEYLHCTWREWVNDSMGICKKPATVCVVYGCLDGHMNEFVGCEHHFNLWVDMVANGDEECNLRACDKMVDSWERTTVSKLSTGFSTYMMTRQ
jgi:hypothetical protein